MSQDWVLDIIAQGAWNGGTPGGQFGLRKQGHAIQGRNPGNPETIEARIGVRTRMSPRRMSASA